MVTDLRSLASSGADEAAVAGKATGRRVKRLRQCSLHRGRWSTAPSLPTSTVARRGCQQSRALWSGKRGLPQHQCTSADITPSCRVLVNGNFNGLRNMAIRASDVVPISEARARLTELAEDVVGSGAEKVLTKNGASYVALVDARRLDYYHALEAEHANLVLADDAITGLKEALAGEFVSDDELDEALGVTPVR